jgi:hypothetical protein
MRGQTVRARPQLNVQETVDPKRVQDLQGAARTRTVRERDFDERTCVILIGHKIEREEILKAMARGKKSTKARDGVRATEDPGKRR